MGGVKNLPHSAFIYSEDNNVTIVASSNILIKVPLVHFLAFKNHTQTSFWELNFLAVQSILFFYFSWKVLLLRNLRKQLTATHKVYLGAEPVIQKNTG